MLSQMAGCPPFSWLNNILLCIYLTPFWIHSSVDGRLGCFHILAIVTNAINMGVHISLQNPVFGFFKKLKIDLPCDSAIPLLGIHPKEVFCFKLRATLHCDPLWDKWNNECEKHCTSANSRCQVNVGGSSSIIVAENIPWCQPWIQISALHLLIMWLWVIYLTFLWLSSLISKMRTYSIYLIRLFRRLSETMYSGVFIMMVNKLYI